MLGAVDREFWGDRLEVGTDFAEKQIEDNELMERWYSQLGPRRRAILADHFGLGSDADKGETKTKILARRDELLPFVLVDAAAAGKRTYAIEEVARAKLAPEDLESCRMKGKGALDRNALMWLLYLDDPEHLEIVFRLDQCQKRGFARMVLPRLPATSGADVVRFFSKDNLQEILDAYEKEKNTKTLRNQIQRKRSSGSDQVARRSGRSRRNQPVKGSRMSGSITT